eukprot:TRINITY_DN12948_c0_g1_i1.p1 TRINITY_DN12948_c0_g1~~TRINITY_DN12948_c0_g1_i1.p1  ORF type:complete len:187 (-),score=31.74 TRINITY_DN12948_c0_g1_i1:129-665(-)
MRLARCRPPWPGPTGRWPPRCFSLAEPTEANAFKREHALLLHRSYERLLGRPLAGIPAGDPDLGGALYRSPFVVLAHDAAADPRLFYANLAAQRLFELSWAEVAGMLSRLTAEPAAAEQRERFLLDTRLAGFKTGYVGTRVSKTGRRFEIRDVTLWNLLDETDAFCGQAVVFHDTRPL